MADAPIFHPVVKDNEIPSPSVLLEMKQKLDNELGVLEIAKDADDRLVEEQDVEELTFRISKLKEELMAESSKVSWKNLLIKRIESGIFSESVMENADNPRNISFINTCLKELELASEIMRIHKVGKINHIQEILNLEERYASEKLINLDLIHDNVPLIQKFNDDKDKVKSISSDEKEHPEYKRLKTELELKTKSVDVKRNVIRQIIIGAGLDWASDPYLYDVITNK